MRNFHGLQVFPSLVLAAAIAGCSTGTSNTQSNNGGSPQAQSGSVYVLGSDAPLPSVISFAVGVQSIALSDGSSTPVSILNGAQTVDFARFNGLSTLLDFNAIPAGTYTTATITLGSANPRILEYSGRGDARGRSYNRHHACDTYTANHHSQSGYSAGRQRWRHGCSQARF